MNVPLLFSHLVVSSSLWPHGLQHTRLPSPSLTTWACSNSWPLSWWYHSTISSSVAPFSSCPQSFPGSGSFPMSWLFPSGGQSIRASASVLPMNIQGWFPLGLIGLICLLSKELSRVFSSTNIQNHQFFDTQPSLVQLSLLYMITEKTIGLTVWTFVDKVMLLLFNMLSWFVIAFSSKKVSSVQFSHSIMSNSLWPHVLQHARFPCPPPTPRACSNSCPLRWWCHPTISSSVIPFSSCLQSFPVSGSLLMSQLLASSGQSIRVSASASVLPMNIQD